MLIRQLAKACVQWWPIMAILALLVYALDSDAGCRRVRCVPVCCPVVVVKAAPKCGNPACQCGDKCNCLGCCCQRQPIIQINLTRPVCVGGCCGK